MSEIAVLYPDYAAVGKPVLTRLRRCGVPVTYFSDIAFSESNHIVKLLTMRN